MTDSVDDKIVEMKFNNKQFEQGVATTLASLEKLKKSLDFANANQNLGQLEKAGSRFTMGNMGTTIDGINAKMAAMATIGITALSQITSSAIHTGVTLAKSLTVDPIKAGLDEYQLKLQAIQTIMAGTGEDIGTVTEKLQELNDYSDKTIYSFADMTQNIGKFTNAGVDLDTAVKAIQGVAQVAAVSGATTEQAAHSMYNFGQAIGQGYVGLVDWKSIDIAGMGTAEFKQQLIDSAVAMGTLKKNGDGTFSTMKGNIVTTKNFTQSLRDQWLTSDALITTLNKYSDPTTAIGKKAFEAAQNVKTLSQVIDIARESAGSGWATTWELLFGNLNQATRTFTKLSNVITGFIHTSADARNKVLKDWAELGGRASLFRGIGNIFEALMAVIKPIKDAFRDIFPAQTGRSLFNLTQGFEKFTEWLIISDKTADGLRRTFAGVFAIFSIAGQVIGGVIRYFADLVRLGARGGDSIFALTGSIGDLLVQFDEWLKKGDFIGRFFDQIISGRAALLEPIIDTVGKIVEAFAALISSGAPVFLDMVGAAFDNIAPVVDTIVEKFHEFLTAVQDVAESVKSNFDFSANFDSAKTSVDGMTSSMIDLEAAGDGVGNVWEKIVDAFGEVREFLEPVWTTVKAAFSGIGDRLSGFVENLNLGDGLAVINTVFFIALYRMFNQFIGSMKTITDSVGDIGTKVGGILDQVTSNLKTMQNAVRARMILNIAIAIGVLAASIFLLSKVDPVRLGTSLAAIGALMLMLMRSLTGFATALNFSKTINMSVLTVGLIGLGIALVSMAAAVAIFGTMDISTIVKGLVSVGLILAGFTTMANSLGYGTGARIAAAALGLMIISGSLVLLAGAVKLYSGIDFSTMLSGLVKITATLVLIGAAMSKMPPNMIGSAIALGVVSVALGLIARALKKMGSLSIGDTIQALILMAGALAILVVAVNALSAGMSGAAALAVISVSLIVLAKALEILAGIGWKGMAIALVTLTALFVILGLAGLILTPVIPMILLLGVAMAALGIGMMAAGVGMFWFATGLALLAASGAAGGAALTAVIISIAELIPLIAEQVGLGIVAIAKVVSESAPVLIAAFATLLYSMLEAAEELAPKLGNTLIVMIRVALAVLRETWPDWVNTAFFLLEKFLEALRERLPGIAQVAVELIALFVWLLALQSPVLIDAAFKAIITFIDGLSRAIDENAEALGAAGGRLAKALGAGIVNGLKGYVGEVFGSAQDLGQAALSGLGGVWKINSPSKAAMELAEGLGEGVVIGINSYERQVGFAAEAVADTALTALGETMARIKEGFVNEVDLVPVITPVLDLTTLKNQALGISGAFGAPTIIPTVSISQADEISAALAASRDDGDEPPKGGDIIFQQHNTSPEALDATEIYRNTRSQLAMAKEALSQT